MIALPRNETLRLQPAAPNGTQRVPPPHEGGPFVIADQYVPSHIPQTLVLP